MNVNGEVSLTGSKVQWITVVNALSVPAGLNTDPINLYQDISGYDEADVYVLCDQSYDLQIRSRKTDNSISYYMASITAQPATSGTVANAHRVEASAVKLRFDKVNPVLTNKGAVAATVTILIRAFRGVKG